MQKLTIVVTCTDRKSLQPSPDLRIRTLPEGDTSTRLSTWRRRIASTAGQLSLNDLYQGEAWLQAKGLASDATRHAVAVRMLVASAGLGLVDVTNQAPSYAATFSSGKDDSVVRDIKRLPDWWAALKEMPNTTPWDDIANGPLLMVLSESYARAMDSDLARIAQRGGDHLLVGGWRNIEGLQRLPADRELRSTLGGSVSSLSLRMARRWLSARKDRALFSSDDQAAWTSWATTARRSEVYARTPASDPELLDLIRGLIDGAPELSASRALRMLRDRGIACEQKRFGALFSNVVATR